MSRLSVLRRLAPLRSNFRRSPEVFNGLALDKRGDYIPQISRSEPWCSSPAPVAASETPGWLAFESFLPVPYFGSLPVSGRKIDNGVLCLRQYCTRSEGDDIALEEEMERKFGWLLKAFFVVTACAVGANFFPYMGDSLLQQSIALLHVKDPLFKRMGASRLRRFAVDDERRMRVVEMGGAQDLLEMLEGARDDKTRKEALKALLALSGSDAVTEVLGQAGAAVLVASVPDSLEFNEIGNCKSSLLERFRELDHNPSPSCVRPTP